MTDTNDPIEQQPESVEEAPATDPSEVEVEEEEERFPELIELQEKIDKRIRSNRRFLERFMDEDFDGLDDEDDEDIVADDDDDPIEEEL